MSLNNFIIQTAYKYAKTINFEIDNTTKNYIMSKVNESIDEEGIETLDDLRENIKDLLNVLAHNFEKINNFDMEKIFSD